MSQVSLLKYSFAWDPIKAVQNELKHKISFNRAATIFHDQNALSIFDVDHSVSEDRFVSMGIDSNGVLLVVVHTFRESDSKNSEIRLISARKASKKEIKQYNGDL